jgi:hypothetical protein
MQSEHCPLEFLVRVAVLGQLLDYKLEETAIGEIVLDRS